MMKFLTYWFAAAVVVMVSSLSSAQQTSTVGLLERRAVISRDISLIAPLAKQHGVAIEGHFPMLSAVFVSSSSSESMRRFESCLAAVPEVRAVENVGIHGGFQTSGPISVPIINPNGNVLQIRSQPGANLALLMGLIIPISGMSTGPCVAILDSGIDGQHPELQGRIHAASCDFIDLDIDPSEVANGIDDDGDGVKDRAYGHGTFLAGLSAVMAPDAEILAIRVVDDEGRGSAPLSAAAIVYAVGAGADIINLSMGFTTPSLVLDEALNYARNQGVLIIVSAGNNSSTLAPFPANHPAVWSVAATTPGTPQPLIPQVPIFPNETIAPFSNWGFVDFAAFGTSVRSLYPGNRYATWNGTSMAAGMTTAAIAVMWSINPNLTHDDLRQILSVSAAPIVLPAQYGPNPFGAGRIDTATAAFLAYLSTF